MNRHLYILFFLLLQTAPSFGQFRWEDPLAAAHVGLADKYGLLYNIAGLALSEILTSDKPQIRPWESAFSLEYQRAYAVEDGSVSGYIGRARIGRQFHRWVQAGLEGQLMVFAEDRFTPGVGGGLYFNWFFMNRPGLRISADFSYGIALSSRPLPSGGTRFNFTRHYGLQAAFRIHEDAYLSMGARTFHLSNAYLFGDERNPALDSFGVVAGVAFPLGAGP